MAMTMVLFIELMEIQVIPILPPENLRMSPDVILTRTGQQLIKRMKGYNIFTCMGKTKFTGTIQNSSMKEKIIFTNRWLILIGIEQLMIK